MSSVVIGMSIYIVVAACMLKLLWAWVIPGLLPGAVAQGLVVAALPWPAAFKLTVLVMVLAIFINRRPVFISSQHDDVRGDV